MNKRNIITILCLVFSVISALAQSQSFYTDNHVVKVGDTYYAAKEVSIQDKQIVITGDNGVTTSIDVEHGKNMPIEVSAEKGILCSVAGTLTKELVNKAIASGHLNICGTINGTDLSKKCLYNEDAAVPVKFTHVSGLPKLTNSYFNFKSATSIIFENCDFSSVTSLYSIFSNHSIKSFSFKGMGLTKVKTLKKTFSNCKSIEDIDFSGFDTSYVTDATELFSSCTSLKVINFSGCDLSNLTTTDNMFADCNSLEKIIVLGCNEQTKEKLNAALNNASLDYSDQILTDE